MNQDGFHARYGCANGYPCKSIFSKRQIHDPVRSVGFVQIQGGSEYSARIIYPLTHDQYTGINLQSLLLSFPNGLSIRQGPVPPPMGQGVITMDGVSL
jgi:hypothetical protein